MPVTRRKPRVKQTRISMSIEDYEVLKRIASQKNTTVSDVLVQAAMTQVAAERADHETMLSIVGMGEGSDTEGSVKHDEALYGR